jgi:hypothetical protein
MAFGVLVIGDEILVGKRQDKHLHSPSEPSPNGVFAWPGPNTTGTTPRG